jgi:hypothetical protein
MSVHTSLAEAERVDARGALLSVAPNLSIPSPLRRRNQVRCEDDIVERGVPRLVLTVDNYQIDVHIAVRNPQCVVAVFR